MMLPALPWLEFTILLPLLGAVVVRFIRDSETASRWTFGISLATLVGSLLPWVVIGVDTPPAETLFTRWLGRPLFAVDYLTAPLLPLVALLHLLVVMATARVKRNRMSMTGHLVAESIRLATFATTDPWQLIGLLVLGIAPLYLELVGRGKPTRVFLIHMAAFSGLMVVGQAAVAYQASWGAGFLLAAVLVRSGTVPAHLWVADLFEHATFGTALLFVLPLSGVYFAVRLVLPIAPDWVLESLGAASLVTALYAAGLAVVQTDARRFFAYLFLSHASLVLVGLELHTAMSLTGALCLWVSVALSLGGVGITLRAVEARYGRVSLAEYSGLYEASPAVAVGFLITGLGSIGFPGTLGFVAAELLVDGAVEANPAVGVGLGIVAALNGIAVVRAYLRVFTGKLRPTDPSLGVTGRERWAIVTVVGMLIGGGLAPQFGVADRHAAGLALPARARTETTAVEIAPSPRPAPGHD